MTEEPQENWDEYANYLDQWLKDLSVGYMTPEDWARWEEANKDE